MNKLPELFLLLSILLLLTACKQKVSQEAPPIATPPFVKGIKIAFGSCNNQEKTPSLWDDITKEKADLWIWLGDNIYADTEDMEDFQEMYDIQNNEPTYKKFLTTTPINGTWDDHDYGVNDGGKEYPQKASSQGLFLDFIGAAEDDPRRTRAGVYSSQILKKNDIEIKIIYLDTRYFRDNLAGKRAAYTANNEGTLLGEEQWQWLETEMSNSSAEVNIIASSIQVLSEEHGWEKWANFPKEKERLQSLIQKHQVTNPVIISGDRHVAEISQENWSGVLVTDITSSPLTSTISSKRPEKNRHRVANNKMEYDRNYGILEIQKEGGNINIVSKIKTAYDQVSIAHVLFGK
jgi:alkaline phosphatase D